MVSIENLSIEVWLVFLYLADSYCRFRKWNYNFSIEMKYIL